MARISINQDKCKSCMLCVSVCPNGLITLSKELNKRGIQSVEFSACGRDDSVPGAGKESKCTGCCMCAIICPDMCIEVWK